MAYASIACPVCGQKSRIKHNSGKLTCLHCGAKLESNAMPTASAQMARGWRSATAGGTGQVPQEVKVSTVKPSTQPKLGWRSATAARQNMEEHKNTPTTEARTQRKIGWKYSTAGYSNQSTPVNIIASSRSTTSPNVISIENPTSRQPSTTKTAATSDKPNSGKAFGFGFLCYVIMATLMAFSSIWTFQSMGYSAYIGPNVISLVLAIIFGLRYKSTGKVFAPLLLSLIVGISLGLVLPHIGVYFIDLRYGK